MTVYSSLLVTWQKSWISSISTKNRIFQSHETMWCSTTTCTPKHRHKYSKTWYYDIGQVTHRRIGKSYLMNLFYRESFLVNLLYRLSERNIFPNSVPRPIEFSCQMPQSMSKNKTKVSFFKLSDEWIERFIRAAFYTGSFVSFYGLAKKLSLKEPSVNNVTIRSLEFLHYRFISCTVKCDK